MKLEPLHLGVKRPVWSLQGIKDRVRSPNPKAARQKIFDRDDHTCRYCGFRSEKYQFIHHLNGFDDDFTEENSRTACSFCHQCFDLQATADMGAGMLIWLPEIGQGAFHHIMRALYVARLTKGEMGDTARDMLQMLSQRREEARKRLGTDNPESLAIVMRDFLSHKAYEECLKQIDGIRLMPLDKRMVIEDDLEFNQFPQMLAYWRSKNGPFHNFTPASWVESLAPIFGKKAA